jgi:5-methylcytosine-specific restriction endonuclease McrA
MKIKDLKPASYKKMICVDCLEEKASADFALGSMYKGKRYLKKYCKACDYKRSRQWKKNNPEKASLSARKGCAVWRNRNKDEYNLKCREQRANNIIVFHEKEREKRRKNPERYRAADLRYNNLYPERRKETYRKYVANNPEYYRIAAKVRRDRKRSNGGDYTHQEWHSLLKLYDSCPACGKKWTEEDRPTVDHIIPISLGGSNYIDNIQPLCLFCNLSKGNRFIGLPKSIGGGNVKTQTA